MSERIRKVLVVMRHGDTPVDERGANLDSLLDKSVQKIHSKVGGDLAEYIGEYGITPDKTSIWHTTKKRTRSTARAAVAGGFRKHFKEAPKTERDLNERYDFS